MAKISGHFIFTPIHSSYLNCYNKIEAHIYRMSLCAVALKFPSLPLRGTNMSYRYNLALYSVRSMLHGLPRLEWKNSSGLRRALNRNADCSPGRLDPTSVSNLINSIVAKQANPYNHSLKFIWKVFLKEGRLLYEPDKIFNEMLKRGEGLKSIISALLLEIYTNSFRPHISSNP